jgi:hypothetical protein
MSALKPVGFFSETGHPGGPSLVESRHRGPQALRARIAAYLQAGTTLSVSSGSYRDWFDSSKKSGTKQIVSDGVWVWPGDLAYYVEQHGVALPQEFLSHMEAMNWSPPHLGHVEIVAACRALSKIG